MFGEIKSWCDWVVKRCDKVIKWFDKIKNYVRKHFGACVGTFAIMMVIIAVCNVIFGVTPEAGRKYWYQDNGHFPWIGISAAAAGIGIFIQAIDNKRKIRLELIIKNHNNWIEMMKPKVVEFLNAGDQYRDTVIEGSSVYEDRAQQYIARRAALKPGEDMNRNRAAATAEYQMEVTERVKQVTYRFQKVTDELKINLEPKSIGTNVDNERSELETAIEEYHEALELFVKSSFSNVSSSNVNLEEALEEINNAVRENMESACGEVNDKRLKVLEKFGLLIDQITKHDLETMNYKSNQ